MYRIERTVDTYETSMIDIRSSTVILDKDLDEVFLNNGKSLILALEMTSSVW